jgi:hypothetical protein
LFLVTKRYIGKSSRNGIAFELIELLDVRFQRFTPRRDQLLPHRRIAHDDLVIVAHDQRLTSTGSRAVCSRSISSEAFELGREARILSPPSEAPAWRNWQTRWTQNSEIGDFI